MPARVAHTPRGLPLKLLIVELRLCEPQYKVSLVALVCVLLNALTNADIKIFLIKVVENIILFQL